MSSDNTDAQKEIDQRVLTQTLVLASDVVTFALTCWLIGLTSQAFGSVSTSATRSAKAANGVAGTFLMLGAAAMLCVSARLFQKHYRDHGPDLFQK